MDAIEEMITNPTVAMGLGDFGAHVGQIMDARSPTWLLAYWVKTWGLMTLEAAIRGWTSATSQPSSASRTWIRQVVTGAGLAKILKRWVWAVHKAVYSIHQLEHREEHRLRQRGLNVAYGVTIR